MSGAPFARSTSAPPQTPSRALFAGFDPDPELSAALEARGVEIASVARAGDIAGRVEEWHPAFLVLDLDAEGAGDVALGLPEAPARVERVALLASSGSVFLAMKCLAARRADHVLMKPIQADELAHLLTAPAASSGIKRLPSLERIQWEYIQAVLGSCDGNVSEAARQLGIYRQSLQRMLRRHPPSR